MERLCVEVLQLIFFELVDPSPLTLVSRRLYSFSQDPYVRARYFLAHYGPAEAMFQALGRGKLLTERVIDILLSSGAHLSRYLVQIAMHHYFHTQTHFIRTPWVRNVPFGVFVYFMQKAHAKYGDIPRGKGEDDGSLFMTFLKESRFPSHLKSVTWENILEILEQYKFMPFSNRDPIMAQFPLILAIEPRLLPAAVENGFRMDYKYRDFVFRKMFERHTGDTQAEDVANNIRELCQLDPTMFVSRTVAAEVCMEAKYNDVGYGALKQLGKTGDLRFELRTLVEDLLKVSPALWPNITVLTKLYSDYPSTDPIVRLVVITAIFISAENSRLEKYTTVLDYAREEIGTNGDGGKGLGEAEARGLVEDVARKCLQVGCKGKLLNRLIEGFPHLKDVLVNEVAERHQIRLEEVPSWVGQGSVAYTAKLSGDYARKRSGESPYWDDSEGNVLTRNVEMGSDQAGNDVDRAPREEPLMLSASEHEVLLSDLGDISQESLTNMIRQDELAPTRARRRWFYTFAYPDFGKANYPHDALPVAKCILNQYGTRSKIVAIFLTHAIINDNTQVLFSYLMRTQDSSFSSFKIDLQVPVTLKHFQILARLGRAPHKATFSLRGRERLRRLATTSVRSYAVPDSDDDIIMDSDDGLEPRRRKQAPKKSDLQLWIQHLAELQKSENKKFKEQKKIYDAAGCEGTTARFRKNAFLKSLSTQLRSLRKLDIQTREKQGMLGEDLETLDDEDDDDEYTLRPSKRKKTCTHPPISLAL
ncbi:hypothetical protein CC2G_013021 [Coprinopsis cinerea AmutBmut pab1-1]|nr:hypothetical protein CC2G_013021 [Coprinopsis cinerea AmutBmut pab1-1]